MMILVADAIIISIAMIFLNLHEAKQYPMFWFGRSWKYGRKKPEWFSWKKRKETRSEDPMTSNTNEEV